MGLGVVGGSKGLSDAGPVAGGDWAWCQERCREVLWPGTSPHGMCREEAGWGNKGRQELQEFGLEFLSVRGGVTWPGSRKSRGGPRSKTSLLHSWLFSAGAEVLILVVRTWNWDAWVQFLALVREHGPGVRARGGESGAPWVGDSDGREKGQELT